MEYVLGFKSRARELRLDVVVLVLVMVVVSDGGPPPGAVVAVAAEVLDGRGGSTLSGAAKVGVWLRRKGER